MTIPQAIAMVRTLLDESGVDYYKDVDILMALEQAQLEKAREYFYDTRGRGKKHFLQPLWRDVSLTNGIVSSRGDKTHVVTGGDTVLFPLQCFVRMYADEPAPTRKATVMSPERYVGHLFSNPTTNTTRSGKNMSSYFGGLLHHNGTADTGGVIACRFIFYAQPTIPTTQSSFSLPVYAHGQIVDRAAQLLNDKNMSDPWHEGVGNIADMIQRAQTKEQ